MGAIATYQDVTDFITGSGLTLPTAAGTAFIQSRLNSAQAYIERQTGRTYSNLVTETRTFDGGGHEALPIDECLVATAVRYVSGGTTVYAYAASEWRLYPLNSLPKNVLQRVVPSIEVLSGMAAPSSWAHVYAWPEGNANIEVDGTWGSGSLPPADLKESVIALATLYVLAGAAVPSVDGAVNAAVRSFSAGGYSVSYASDTKEVFGILTGWRDMIDTTIQAYKLMRPN